MDFFKELIIDCKDNLIVLSMIFFLIIYSIIYYPFYLIIFIVDFILKLSHIKISYIRKIKERGLKVNDLEIKYG